MIRRLILENFMAHKLTELELGPGLSVLTGPNNSGKSAVVEALRCLSQNPPSGGFIHHGAKLAKVTVELEDGVRITWIRKPDYAMYEVLRPGEEKPQIYAKVRNKAPEDILDLLRLDLVELEGRKDDRTIDVHLGNQREPIFLLNKPGSVVASFFAASTESAHLLAMQQALKNRTQLATSEERGLEARRAGVLARLSGLSGLPDLALALDAATAAEEAAQASARAIPGLEAVLARLAGLERQRAALSNRLSGLAGLAPAPGLAPAAALARTLDRLDGLLAARSAAQARLAALTGLDAPPAVSPPAPLAGLLRALERTGQAKSATARRHAALAGLRPPGEITSLSGLRRTGADIAAARQARDVRAARVGRLADLRPAPEPAPVSGLRDLLRDMASLRRRAAEARAGLEARSAALDAARHRIAEFLRQAGNCPLCGHPLDMEHFLDGGGHGA